jgi:hypothetical protein
LTQPLKVPVKLITILRVKNHHQSFSNFDNLLIYSSLIEDCFGRGKRMKSGLILILLTLLVLVSTSGVFAQGTSDAAEKADNLRLQLLEVQSKEAALQERVRQLDEDLKPENIERSLAGIGSTRPEELRELRRRQLQIERDSLLTQLEHLAKSRASLESAIAAAEAEAYHQSANGPATLNQVLVAQIFSLPKWVAVLVLILPALGIVGLLLVIRRLRSV